MFYLEMGVVATVSKDGCPATVIRINDLRRIRT